MLQTHPIKTVVLQTGFCVICTCPGPLHGLERYSSAGREILANLEHRQHADSVSLRQWNRSLGFSHASW